MDFSEEFKRIAEATKKKDPKKAPSKYDGKIAELTEFIDNEYNCGTDIEYVTSKRPAYLRIRVMPGSSIRKGIKAGLKASGLDADFDPMSIEFYGDAWDHDYHVYRRQTKEKPAAKVASVEDIAADAAFDADKWLRLDPEELEGLSKADRRSMISDAVDNDLEEYFPNCPFEIDEKKIPAIKQEIIKRLV